MMQAILLTIVLNFGGGLVTITTEVPDMETCEQQLRDMQSYFGGNELVEILEAKCEAVQ